VKYQNVYFVILAGGSGTRLWPLSRLEKPKQFLQLGNKKTLLEQTVDRIYGLAQKENIWISTTKQHKKTISKLVGNKIGNIIEEPGAKNTGPAILLACMHLLQYSPNASVIFLPSDQFIPDKEKFVDCIRQAIHFTQQENYITLLGVKPHYPATGYGYIEFDKKKREAAPFFVKTFHEKPSLPKAKKYITQENILWNLGIFCSKVQLLINEFKRESPELFQGVYDYMHGKKDYNTIEASSIDHTIIEKSKNIVVLPAKLSWCDVGTIEDFLSVRKQHIACNENIITVRSNNSLIDTKNKLVVLIDVDNICVVETDDILLIAKRDKTQAIKKIVTKLKKEHKNYL